MAHNIKKIEKRGYTR